ncbi:MAG: hypothetical protein HYU69_00005 [Bacteroidetes bacterium]|nr:hypothetical protein [Bacteroidota bacterium]
MKQVLTKYSNVILLIIMVGLIALQMFGLITSFKVYDKTFDYTAVNTVKDAGRNYTYFLAADFIHKIDSVLSRKPIGIKNKCNVDDLYSMEGKQLIFSTFNHEDSIYFMKLSKEISKIDTVSLINILKELVLKNGIDSKFK